MPVTRIEVTQRGALSGGKPFGDAGPYEYLAGVMHFTADPQHPQHAVICDIELAPTNADGLVEYSSEFHLLKPVEAPAGGRLLVDSINRGNMTALSMFNSALRRADGNPDVDTGNGFLMRHGYSVLSVGIQWDPPDSPERMRAWFPEAMQDGQRLTGKNFVQWWPNRVTPHQLLSDAGHKPYPTADLDDPDAVLAVREHQDGDATVIDRSSWRFAREVDGNPQPSAEHVWLEGGFQPGMVYEITYTAIGAPVIGLGFLAYRDAASFLKHGSDEDGNPLAGSVDTACAWGQSMNGRWLREYLYWGLNRDEAGRVVFDGMLAHIGSSRRGEFNLRFGQPSTNILRAPGNLYPFAFEATPDPATEENRGLLDRSREDGSMPKVVHVNSGMEYWWSGASLGHTTVDGTRDLAPPEDVCMYYLSGSQHGPSALPLTDKTVDGFQAQQPINTLDYRPAMRALLTALDRWVREGEPPPPNRVPRIDDGTAAPRESLEPAYRRIPGVHWPAHLPQRLRMDYGPDPDDGVLEYPPKESGVYPVLVSALDDDGNDRAGIRLPDIAVPLATYAGWNTRHESMGSPGLMTSGSPLFGSTWVFPRTASERAGGNDPRPAIDERYASKQDYLARVEAAARELVTQRYMLEEDVERCVKVAGEKWDAFRGA
jgi:hypothetical protein